MCSAAAAARGIRLRNQDGKQVLRKYRACEKTNGRVLCLRDGVSKALQMRAACGRRWGGGQTPG